MKNKRLWGVIAVEIVALIVLGTLAVTVTQGTSRERPTTVIEAPVSNSEYPAGETVAIQSASTDSTGVARVELSIDGTIIDTDMPPQPQMSFTVIQTWTATEGVHTITARAFNQNNQGGNLAAIRITVLPAETTKSISTPVPTSPRVFNVAPVATPNPTETPTSLPAVECTNNSAFVTDVTVPDGTAITAGQTFNKIWRVLNNGSCAWGNGYTFTYIGGDLMGASSAIAVPNTPPGATADLLVPMTAP